ncbi:MAG: MMPL family transporter [Planctomycetia bacterium]|nr:MMPL family transporter [Planctomycetia bacterium]
MRKDFFTKYAFRILFIVVFLLAFVWMGTKKTIQSNSNSVEDWLPEQFQQTRDYRWFLEHFPFESYVVVSWEGCTLDDDKLELFAQKLVPEQTIDNFSLLTATPNLKAELNLEAVSDLVQKEIALEKQAESISALAEMEMGQESKSVKKESEDESYFKSVMTGPRLVRLLEQTYSKIRKIDLTPEELHELIISQLQGTLIGPDGKNTAMIITLNKGKRDGKSLEVVLKKIRNTSVECGLPDTSEIQVGSVAERMVDNFKKMCIEMFQGRHPRTDGAILGGPPVDNVALNYEGERTLFRLAGLCALIGVTLALLCFRDVRLTMFIFWISLLSAGIAMAFVSLTGGTCDSILLSMPALVYVLAMSGSIHLINYYHDAIREKGLPGATERAVQHAFTPCFFAQLTTAIGLGSLFIGKLIPITKFGFYSAVGVLTTLLLLFFYLPALLYFYPSKKFAALHGGKGLEVERSNLISQFWDFFGSVIVKNHNIVVVICIIICCFFAYNLKNINVSVKMMNFFTPDAEIISHYSWLEEKLGPLVPMELVLCFDNNSLDANTFGTSERLSLVNQVCNELKTKLADDVGGTISVATFAPNLDAILEPGRFYQAASVLIGKTINENRQNLRDYLTVEGNPSLNDISICLAEKTTQLENNYKTHRNDLKERMQNDGLSLEELETIIEKTDFSSNDLSMKNIESEKLTDSSEKEKMQQLYRAEVQELRFEYHKYIDFKKIAQIFNSSQKNLESIKITDLNGIMKQLDPSRPLQDFDHDLIQSIRKAAEIWQQEKGIELWRISIRVWALKKDIDYSLFIESVKKTVEPILKNKSEEIVASLSILADESNESGLQTYSETNNSNLAQNFGDSHKMDTIYPAGISAKYTGMVPMVYKTQHELINGLVQSLIMAFFLIAIVFMILLRSPFAGIVAMLPNLFPVICVFGYMAWRGILVDVGTMMTASVALGVAVDDTMHYLTWFSDGINKGASPYEAARGAYRRCATAMTQSTLIAGLGLSAFMFSTFVPTQRFGALMLAILFVALIGDLVFLPALLTSKIGRFFILRRKPIKKESLNNPESN